MTTRSLVALDSRVENAVEIFYSAACLIRDGRTGEAEPLIERLDDGLLRSHWIRAMTVWRDRLISDPSLGVERVNRPRIKFPPAATQRAIFERDGWRCRWCTARVIDPRAFRRMHLVFPVSFQRGSTDGDRHGLILAARSSLDHVLPCSHGGDNSDDNLVTACWPYQFGRGDYTIEQLGLADPRDYPAVCDGWDGVSWFRA